MTTSGTTAFDLDIVGIIEEAWRRLGIEPQSLKAGHLASARVSLNLILREWDLQKLCNWALVSFTATTVVGQPTALPADTLDVVPELTLVDDQLSLQRVPYWEWTQLPSAAADKPAQYRIDRTTIPPRLHFYPLPDAAYALSGWRLRRMQDVDGFTDTTDVPARWLPMLIAELAMKLYAKLPPADRVAQLRADLGEALVDARRALRIDAAEPGSWYY